MASTSTALDAAAQPEQPVQLPAEGPASGVAGSHIATEQQDEEASGSEDEDEDEDAATERRRRRAEKAVAAAAAAAAAEAAAAEAAAAAATAAAAASRPPRPFAPGLKPRIFVISGSSGYGYEILSEEDVGRYQHAVCALPGGRHKVEEAWGAAEPGSTSHSFVVSIPQHAEVLAPLPLADASHPVSAPGCGSGGLSALLRPSVLHLSSDVGGCTGAGEDGPGGEPQPALGLKLPPSTAVAPPGAAAAGSAGMGTLMVGFGLGGSTGRAIAGDGAGAAAAPVMVVREVTEAPQMTPELTDAVAAALARHAAVEAERGAAIEAASAGAASDQRCDAELTLAAEVEDELAGVIAQLQQQQAAMEGPEQQGAQPQALASGKEQACLAAAQATLADAAAVVEVQRQAEEEAAAAVAAEAAAKRKVKR